MMLRGLRFHYRWKYLIVLTLIAMSAIALVFFVLPVCLKTESTLRITAIHENIALPDGFYVYQRLNEHGVMIKSITPGDNALLIKFDSKADGMAAEKILHAMFPHEFTIAPLQIDNIFSVNIMNHRILTTKTVAAS